MSSSEEQWMDSWQAAAKKRRTRSVLMTFALLLPAIFLAASLTKVSTDAVSERDHQITTLQDSIELMQETSIESVPILSDSLPDVDSAIVVLNRELGEQNRQLRDSLRKQSEIFRERGNNDQSDTDELKKQLASLEEKLKALTTELRSEQSQNKQLCAHLSSIQASLNKVESSASRDKNYLALVRLLKSELKESQILCR